MDDSDDFEYDPSKYPKRTQEEIDKDVEEFINHPLNVKNFDPKMLEDENFQAIQALVYEGTPDEVASRFLARGDEYLIKKIPKQYLEAAKTSYESGIEQNPESKDTNYRLLFGKASVNFLSRNYGRCIEDVEKALKIKENEEAYHLIARTLEKLQKYDKLVDICKKILKINPESKEAKHMMMGAMIELKKIEDKQREINEKKKKEKEKEQIIQKAMKDRNIKIGKRLQDIPDEFRGKTYLDADNYLHFPLLLLYDEYLQSDFIQDFHEMMSLEEQFQEVFSERAGWDTDGKYKLGNVEAYYESNSSASGYKYVKCDLNTPLVEILSEKYHTVPEFPVIHVVANNSPFREHFIKEK